MNILVSEHIEIVLFVLHSSIKCILVVCIFKILSVQTLIKKKVLLKKMLLINLSFQWIMIYLFFFAGRGSLFAVDENAVSVKHNVAKHSKMGFLYLIILV